MSRANDYSRYETLLTATQDRTGLVRRDEAMRLLAEELTRDAARVEEFAYQYARAIADGFDKKRQPKALAGQMRFGDDDYLVVGENERIPAPRALSRHTRDWLAIQSEAHQREVQAFRLKEKMAHALLAIQDQHGCSLTEAQRIYDADVAVLR